MNKIAVAVAFFLMACGDTVAVPMDAAPPRDFSMQPHDLATRDGSPVTHDLAVNTDLGTGADLASTAAPTLDGVISPGEYGEHTDGKNQLTSGSTIWYATWDDTYLYVAVATANIDEAAVIYLDVGIHPTVDGGSIGGSNADGNLAAQIYDGTGGSLPFRADFVAYVKNGYNEFRTADGAGAWSAATSNMLDVATGTDLRELRIPWSATGGRPSTFGWLGYVTSSGGFVYAPVPVENPSGSIGTAAAFTHYFDILDARPATATKPFADDVTP